MYVNLPHSLSFFPSGKFTIETDDLDLHVAGVVIQSLASDLGLDDLSVTDSFPQQMKELREIMEKVYSI